MDYKYGPQTPYLSLKFEIFPHLWEEKFSYEKFYTKKRVYFLMELSLYLIDKTRLVT